MGWNAIHGCSLLTLVREATSRRLQREPCVQCFGASRAFADSAIARDQHRCAPQAELRREFQVAIKDCRVIRAVGHGVCPESLGDRARFRTKPGQQEGVDRHVVELGELFVQRLAVRTPGIAEHGQQTRAVAFDHLHGILQW